MMDEILASGFVTNVHVEAQKEISNDSDNVSIRGEYILLLMPKPVRARFYV